MVGIGIKRVIDGHTTLRTKRAISRHHRRTAAIGQHQVKVRRSEEHTSELQSLMRISYAVFCLKKKKHKQTLPRQHRERRLYDHKLEQQTLIRLAKVDTCIKRK